MKEKTFRTIKFLGLTLGIALSIFAISLAVYAWTAPTAAPPGGNVPAPINVGTTTQTKAGALGVGGVFTANSAVHLAVGGGNVGIGTTAPGERLEVAGNIRLAGANPTHRITNLASPIAANDAATRGYVDAQAGGGGVLITWGFAGHQAAAGTNAPACPSGWTLVYNGWGWVPYYTPAGTVRAGIGQMHCNAHGLTHNIWGLPDDERSAIFIVGSWDAAHTSVASHGRHGGITCRVCAR